MTAAVALLAVAAGALAVRSGGRAGGAWTAVAVPVAGYELWYLRERLGLNHPVAAPGEAYDGLGPPNAVTVLRGVAFAAVAGFAAVDPTPAITWLPAVCYGVGVALDAVDGSVARALNRETALGDRLDVAFDGVGVLVAAVVAVRWGRLPAWYLLLAVASPVFVSACRLRRRRGLPVGDLPASRVRRPLAGLGMATLAVALAPPTPDALVRVLAALVVVPSLAVFVRDYLAVTGRWS